MGENSLERKHGRLVRASDSWQAGVNGGKPGIIMEGAPKPADVYRQEYYPPGGGLDQARVIGTIPKMTVPAGTYGHVLSTIEWSPVEPQLEKKWYAAGVGEIKEKVVAGGHERFQLVRVTHRSGEPRQPFGSGRPGSFVQRRPTTSRTRAPGGGPLRPSVAA
jgi:hypothetical protein